MTKDHVMIVLGEGITAQQFDNCVNRIKASDAFEFQYVVELAKSQGITFDYAFATNLMQKLRKRGLIVPINDARPMRFRQWKWNHNV